MEFRVLIDEVSGHAGRVLAPDDLTELYAVEGPRLRANFVATIDGAASGPDGLTGSINNAVDKIVFNLLRRQADAIVVGTRTARIEQYNAAVRPTVLLGRSSPVPPSLRSTTPGAVYLAAPAGSPALADGRAVLGDDFVIELDPARDLADLRPALAERGFANLLTEGGPEVFGTLLHAAAVDELCLTTVPLLRQGGQLGIVGDGASVVPGPARLLTLIECEGTLLARWELAGR